MANRITKNELIDDITHSIQNKDKNKKNISRSDVAYIIDELFDRMSEALANSDDVFIWGFGTFTLVKRAQRKFLDLNTHEMKTLPCRVSTVFKAGDTLTRRISKENKD